eukprot:TRINITY_DN6918_c0_g5_i1.p1 TRINITY_DN6918_c0_g5~~TRINITY_DN6918_c0_g5_i1.p1  ORF type:complete len:320 (-),score=31.24 TRINITY_DN6918_c0_g5_i1:308-1267(-)
MEHPIPFADGYQEPNRLRGLRHLFQSLLKHSGGACDLSKLSCKAWRKSGDGLGSLASFLKSYPNHFSIVGQQVHLLGTKDDGVRILLPAESSMIDAFRGELRRHGGSCDMTKLGELPRWKDQKGWGHLSRYLACYPVMFDIDNNWIALKPGTGKNRSACEILASAGQSVHGGNSINEGQCGSGGKGSKGEGKGKDGRRGCSVTVSNQVDKRLEDDIPEPYILRALSKKLEHIIGEWIPADEFESTLSESSFALYWCACGKNWVCSHRRWNELGTCKSCKDQAYPFYMWSNDYDLAQKLRGMFRRERQELLQRANDNRTW